MSKLLRPEDLLGIAEAAQLFGVTRQAFANYRVRYPDFPSAFVELKCGPVFIRDELLSWQVLEQQKNRALTQKTIQRYKKMIQALEERLKT